MPQPVEIDIAVGIHENRVAFHLEQMAHVDPWEFVTAIQQTVARLLGHGSSAPSTCAEDDNQEPAVAPDSGSVVSGEAGSESSTTDSDPAEPEEPTPASEPEQKPKPVARIAKPKPTPIAEETTAQRWERMERERHARIEAAQAARQRRPKSA